MDWIGVGGKGKSRRMLRFGAWAVGEMVTFIKMGKTLQGACL